MRGVNGLKKHIHHFWQAWGRDTRRNPPCWPQKSVMWRIWREQGAGSSPFGPRIPRVEYSEQDFYRAQRIWRTMPEDLHKLTYFLYAVPWFHRTGIPVWQQQVKALKTSKSQYYRKIQELHEYTEERM